MTIFAEIASQTQASFWMTMTCCTVILTVTVGWAILLGALRARATGHAMEQEFCEHIPTGVPVGMGCPVPDGSVALEALSRSRLRGIS